MTVCEIAEACHMCDRYYFSSRFKKRFVISPIRLRKIAESGGDGLKLPDGIAPLNGHPQKCPSFSTDRDMFRLLGSGAQGHFFTSFRREGIKTKNGGA